MHNITFKALFFFAYTQHATLEGGKLEGLGGGEAGKFGGGGGKLTPCSPPPPPPHWIETWLLEGYELHFGTSDVSEDPHSVPARGPGIQRLHIYVIMYGTMASV